ncbi:MAG: LamG domain-containing protein [Acetatifactor sp.]|nr:LamG domain-containing protein [Acetatifactor sp.]
MKKKVFAALLSATMVMSMMTGCGSEPEQPADNSVEQSTEESSVEPSSVEESSVEESTEESSEEEPAGGLAEAEALPDALYHFAMDGTDEGILTMIQSEDVGSNTGATYGVVESSTYVDRDGAEQPIVVQYADGPVGKCTYIDGNFGLSLPVEALNTNEYTISFWMNADRLSNYGPTLQLGSNMGMADTDSTVKWINVTQTEWGTGNTKIFPVVWDRNSETGVWPWVYAADDSIHGKKEWVLVTLVATGDQYNFADDGLDRIAAKFYLNGELAFDAAEGTYGGLAPDVLSADDNFQCFFGINYWDSVFKGFVDELYIFDQALTDGQVASLYLEGNPNVESVAEAPAEVEAEADPVAIDHSAVTTTGTVVGATDCSTAFWSEFSDVVAVPSGESVTVNFVNYTSGLENWHNFAVVLQNVADAHSADDNADYKEYGVMRADNFGWGAGYEGIATAECDWNWDTFKTDMDGANVELTITNNGDTADVKAVVTTADGTVYNQSYTGVAVDGDLYYCLTLECAFLDIQ